MKRQHKIARIAATCWLDSPQYTRESPWSLFFSLVPAAQVNWWTVMAGVAAVALQRTDFGTYIQAHAKLHLTSFHDTVFVMGRSKSPRMVWSGDCAFVWIGYLVIWCSGAAAVGAKHEASICRHVVFLNCFWFIKMCAEATVSWLIFYYTQMQFLYSHTKINKYPSTHFTYKDCPENSLLCSVLRLRRNLVSCSVFMCHQKH